MNPFRSGDNKSKSSSTPWAPAKDALTGALDLVSGQDPWSVYGGNELAGFTQPQHQAMQQGQDWYGNPAGAQTMFNQGQNMLGAYGGAQDFYQNAMYANAPQNRGADLGMAAAYANNPYMNQMIDAGAQDIRRNLFENQLPALAGGAAQSGNLGSTWRGAREGIAMRGAADAIGNMSAGLRGQAWNQGLQYANAIAAQNANFAMQQQGINMGAAAGMAGIGQAGGNMMQTGQNMFTANNQGLMGIGNLQQQQDQAGLDIARNNYYLGQQMPYNQALMASNVALPIGTAFATTNTKGGGGGASPLQQGMGLGLQGAGIWNMTRPGG
jgi:hypothetical protein